MPRHETSGIPKVVTAGKFQSIEVVTAAAYLSANRERNALRRMPVPVTWVSGACPASVPSPA